MDWKVRPKIQYEGDCAPCVEMDREKMIQDTV